MEKKGVYFARKFILAVGVFFLLLIYGIFDPLLLRGW